MLLFCQCFDVWRLLGTTEKPEDDAARSAATASAPGPDTRAVAKAA